MIIVRIVIIVSNVRTVNMVNNVNIVNGSLEGTVYGNIEVIENPLISGQLTLKDFPGFSYEPIPIGTIVEVISIGTSPDLVLFSAPNPITGTCSGSTSSLQFSENTDTVNESNTDGEILQINLPPSSYDPIIINNTDSTN